MKKLTIFTPTYNRANILPRLYNSLINQTNNKFVWLIVDDGSTDVTQELINQWIKDAEIQIKYIYQENSGKHVAHNTGVLNCKTDLFFCVDSDDYLSANAVEIIMELATKITEIKELAGIIALKSNVQGQISGLGFPQGVKRTTLFNLYDKYKFTGETALIFKTAVLKQFLFPIFPDEKFVTEAAVYDKISQHYEMLICREVLYFFEYMPDGYTENINQILSKNPKGYLYFLEQRISMYHFSIKKLKSAVRYLRWGYQNQQKQLIHLNRNLFIYLLAWPIARLLILREKVKIYNKSKVRF